MNTIHNESDHVPAALSGSMPGLLSPAVDVFEDEGGMTLMAYFPDAVDVKLNWRAFEGHLLLCGSVAVAPENPKAPSPHGTALPQWQRMLHLGPDMDASQCRAAFKYGLLRLRVPRVGHSGQACLTGLDQESSHATR